MFLGLQAQDGCVSLAHMKPLKECINFLLAGFALVVGAVLYLLWGDYGWLYGLAACFAIFLGGMLVWVFFWELRGGYDARYPKGQGDAMASKTLGEEEMTSRACLKVKRPYSLLSSQFAELAKRNDLIVADDPPGFLSWNSGSYAIIQIHHSGEGSDDWQALFWLRGGQSLTDAQLEAICRKRGVTLSEHCRDMKAEGFALYQDGQISVYPAVREEEFRCEFMETVLARGKAFREWVADYYDDSEGDA